MLFGIIEAIVNIHCIQLVFGVCVFESRHTSSVTYLVMFPPKGRCSEAPNPKRPVKMISLRQKRNNKYMNIIVTQMRFALACECMLTNHPVNFRWKTHSKSPCHVCHHIVESQKDRYSDALCFPGDHINKCHCDGMDSS